MTDGKGLDPLTIIYGQVSVLSSEVKALKETTAPVARVEAVEQGVEALGERIAAAIQQREMERQEAVDLLKNGNDNRTKLWLGVLALIQAAVLAWIAAGQPTP